MLSTGNPGLQTIIFSIVIGISLLLSVRRIREHGVFPLSLTQELKGFAILAIIFAHIGYFLFSDNFLYPLSLLAGVGVNLFLFLSGYGISLSTYKKPLGILGFYRKRLSRLYLPFWITLFGLLLANIIFLHETPAWSFVGRAALGYFPHSDIYRQFNAVLWFFTLIVGYYILFPLTFNRKYLFVSAVMLGVIGEVIVALKLSFLSDVQYLYSVHVLAFPLGVLAAYLAIRQQEQKKPEVLQSIKQYLGSHRVRAEMARYATMIVSMGVGIYLTANAMVNTTAIQEQLVSVVTMMAILVIFILMPVRFSLLYMFGTYSYEIYLLHWLILYRYDLLYVVLPASVATVLYLVLFLALGFIIQWLSSRVQRVILKDGEA